MPTDEQYRDAALSQWRGPDGIFDVDDDAPVARTKGGAWVQVWVRINDEDVPNQGQFGVGA